MNQYCKSVLLMAVMLLFGLIKANAQDEKLKAIFMYNFTRYLDWPEKQGNFTIMILGKSPLYSELSDIASKKQVGSKTIEVKSIGSPQDITDCHIVYVTSAKTDMITSIQQVARNKKFLIISESDGACTKGSCINFINPSGKLSFEIAKNNISAYGLILSSALLQLGVEAK